VEKALAVYRQGKDGTRTAPGKQAGNKQKRDENTGVPDFQDPANLASGGDK